VPSCLFSPLVSEAAAAAAAALAAAGVAALEYFLTRAWYSSSVVGSREADTTKRSGCCRIWLCVCVVGFVCVCVRGGGREDETHESRHVKGLSLSLNF
jgi:hypothetical protein